MRAAPGLWRILPALALWLAAAGRPAAAPAQQPEVLELDAGGIPVLLERVPNGVVAAQVFIRGGAANLTPQNAGIERLLFEAAERGTEKYPKDLFHARLAGTGTTVSGNAGYDYSTFAMRTVRESWDEAWDLFTQALLKPALPPNEVVLAREQLLNAVRQRRDNPDA
ncbi:MAG: insulinase family protein [Gemmatimonadota bacterium]